MRSRDPRPFAVYGFATTHDALAAEARLKSVLIPVVPIPSPKELGELCGIALRVAMEDVSRVESALIGEGVRWTLRVDMQDV